MPVAKLQIGKQKLTPNFIETLKKSFEKVQNIKVSVLKSARENKGDVKKYADEILNELGDNYTAKVIGFTIVLKKWRRKVR